MDPSASQTDSLRRAATALRAARERIDELERHTREPIAIIGMACRIPGGGDDPDSLWSMLSTGVDAVTPIPPERLALLRALGDTGFDMPELKNTHGAFLSRIEEFEPAFFGLTERESRRMDPQHRLLLEVAWQALENAALKPSDPRDSRTGLFVGICFEDFAHLGLVGRTSASLDVALSIGSSRSIGVGRVGR